MKRTPAQQQHRAPSPANPSPARPDTGSSLLIGALPRMGKTIPLRLVAAARAGEPPAPPDVTGDPS